MERFRVLDLFCGIGGLSSGFSENDFNVTGVDKFEDAGKVYREFASPNFIKKDLGEEMMDSHINVQIIYGTEHEPDGTVEI